MKNVFLIFASLFTFVFAASSCNKTYECVCKNSFGKEETYLVKGTQKKEARTNCDAQDINGNCQLGAKK
jgi:hypothetical protein